MRKVFQKYIAFSSIDFFVDHAESYVQKTLLARDPRMGQRTMSAEGKLPLVT